MTEKARHYFVYGNTAQGFINLLDSNLFGIDKLFILRGRHGTGKLVMADIINGACETSGLFLEKLHCPSAPETLDGIILPQLSIAILDKTDVHTRNQPIPDIQTQFIDTAEAFSQVGLLRLQENASSLFSEIQKNHENAFQHYKKALSVHDEWEKIYIENMDFSKADTLADDTIEKLLGPYRLNKEALRKDRFFGAGTPSGALDFIESLTENISKRYLLKGQPGTGKSTLLKKLVAASSQRGLDTEVYSCAFDSNSLDMIIWPELDLCVFDSTAPHLYMPSRTNDEVIDLYATCVKPGTDEKYDEALSDITARYTAAVKSGTACLEAAKKHLDELTVIYSGIFLQQKAQCICEAFTRVLKA